MHNQPFTPRFSFVDSSLGKAVWFLSAIGAMVTFGMNFGRVAYDDGTFVNQGFALVGMGIWPESIPVLLLHSAIFALLTIPAGVLLGLLVSGYHPGFLSLLRERPQSLIDAGALTASISLLLMFLNWGDVIFLVPAGAYLITILVFVSAEIS